MSDLEFVVEMWEQGPDGLNCALCRSFVGGGVQIWYMLVNVFASTDVVCDVRC